MFLIITGVLVLVLRNNPDVSASLNGMSPTLTAWFSIVLEVITLLVARGLFKGSRTARSLVAGVMILNILNGVFAAVNGQLISGIVSCLLAVIVIAVL